MSAPGEDAAASPPRKTRRRWRRPLLNFLAGLAPPVLRLWLRFVQVTLRIEYVNDQALRARWAAGERVIIAFWHNRLILLPIIAGDQPFCIMVSTHRDGEIGTRLLEAWGIATVRGSATRGAVGGFLRLVHAFRHGRNLAVLPDGPRGPRYVAKPGAVHLARALGAPIVPMAYAAEHVLRLKSWDRLMMPWPFTRFVVEVGDALAVPPRASAEELEALRAELEERLTALTESVERRFPAAREDGRSALGDRPRQREASNG